MVAGLQSSAFRISGRCDQLRCLRACWAMSVFRLAAEIHTAGRGSVPNIAPPVYITRLNRTICIGACTSGSGCAPDCAVRRPLQEAPSDLRPFFLAVVTFHTTPVPSHGALNSARTDSCPLQSLGMELNVLSIRA